MKDNILQSAFAFVEGMTNCENVYETTNHGIRMVYLQNDLIKLGILLDRGADIFDLIYKPMEMNFLMHTKKGLSQYSGRDLVENRLKNYSELYPGGWQDVLPNKAMWKGGEVNDADAGEAATLPWQYEIIEINRGSLSLKFHVRLPITPFYVEKMITLQEGSSMFTVQEKIVNMGEDKVDFFWTQHPAFGGDFLDENVNVSIPKCKAFNVKLFQKNGGSFPENYEESVDNITTISGNPYNLLKVRPRGDGEGCYIALKNLETYEAELYHSKKDIGVKLKWDGAVFPYLRYWVSNCEDAYTVALEPASSPFSSLEDALIYGGYLTINSGESINTWVKCELFKK